MSVNSIIVFAANRLKVVVSFVTEKLRLFYQYIALRLN